MRAETQTLGIRDEAKSASLIPKHVAESIARKSAKAHEQDFIVVRAFVSLLDPTSRAKYSSRILMAAANPSESTANTEPALARRLGLFDATMIVMGGIIGSGIFMNPSVVARQVSTPFLILGVWALGGLVALIAAFIWAELAALRPEVGGQYAYLREAYHPLVAFLYGWGLLLVIQTGGHGGGSRNFRTLFFGVNSPAGVRFRRRRSWPSAR